MIEEYKVIMKLVDIWTRVQHVRPMVVFSRSEVL